MASNSQQSEVADLLLQLFSYKSYCAVWVVAMETLDNSKYFKGSLGGLNYRESTVVIETTCLTDISDPPLKCSDSVLTTRYYSNMIIKLSSIYL